MTREKVIIAVLLQIVLLVGVLLGIANARSEAIRHGVAKYDSQGNFVFINEK